MISLTSGTEEDIDSLTIWYSRRSICNKENLLRAYRKQGPRDPRKEARDSLEQWWGDQWDQHVVRALTKGVI